jgi:hypothetical protein
MKFDFRGSSFDFTVADDSEIQSRYDSQPFQRWLSSLDLSLSLLSVQPQSVVRARDGRLTWLKISTVTERNGGRIPQILVLDGRFCNDPLPDLEQAGRGRCVRSAVQVDVLGLRGRLPSDLEHQPDQCGR